MKIYTKTGDKATTALFTGKRVPKHHIRIESYGTLDELNSNLGLLRDQEMDANSKEVLGIIQNKLFTLGAILATEPSKDNRLKIPRIHLEDIQLLEQEIDKMNEELHRLSDYLFVLARKLSKDLQAEEVKWIPEKLD